MSTFSSWGRAAQAAADCRYFSICGTGTTVPRCFFLGSDVIFSM